MLRKLRPDEPQKYDYQLKHMTTVGKPIEPDVCAGTTQPQGTDPEQVMLPLLASVAAIRPAQH
jgi:hypothetical protein